MNNRIDIAALILRVSLGTMFLAHGLLKVFVFTLPGTAGFFESVGFPGSLAYLVTATEIGGGILLIGGIAVRPIAIALAPVLLGALHVHWGAGWVFSNANGGWEYPAYLLTTSIATALLGPGRFAVTLPLAAKPATAADPA